MLGDARVAILLARGRYRRAVEEPISDDDR